MHRIYSRLPRKKFSTERKTNIVITGAARGIGLRLAQEFIAKNSQEVNLFLVDIKDELLKKGLPTATNINIIKADLSKSEDIEAMWKQIITKCKRVDILINNAARVQGKRLKDMSMDDFRKSIETNLLAYVHLSKLFLD